MGTVKIVSAWPATGKSTLALQYLFINYRERKPNGLETIDWVMDLDRQYINPISHTLLGQLGM